MMDKNRSITIPTRSEAALFSKTIYDWAIVNYSDYSWRRTSNHWHALVAEIMLQRTSAEQVLPIYISFCDRFKTPSDYLLFSDGSIFDKLGLRWRAKKLFELAEVLSENDLPEEKELLLKLPGVGEYIAAAYRSMHLCLYDVIIDSNVVRLYGRYFGFCTDGETRRKKEFKVLASELTPAKAFTAYNYGLIDFTRKICRPKPICTQCILRYQCKKYTGVNYIW